MSAAGLIGMGINIVAIGTLSGVLGYVIDIINGQTILFNLTHATLNTMNYITLVFWIFPFIFLFLSVINYVVQSGSEAGGYA